MKLNTFKPVDGSLEEAKQFLRDNWDRGVLCPCCKQFVKLYKRKLNASMAYVLIMIYKTGNQNFFHIENFLKESDCPAAFRADFHKLVHWKLLEAKVDGRDDGSFRNGFYRITQYGREFVESKMIVPSAVFIYNNTVYKVSTAHIPIHQALGKKFNYRELMDTLGEASNHVSK